MTSITLTYGLPASGKTTWAKAVVEYAEGQVVRVNMDDIRAMLGFGAAGPLEYSKELENTALKIQDKAIVAAVAGGHDVIVDNTHIEQKMPKRIKRLFDGDVQFCVADFTGTSVADCIANDAARSNPVGAETIRKMAGRLSKGSWRLTPEWMNDVTLSEPYTPVQGMPKAILVDIDGTIARHDHRSPYDYSRLHTDGVHIHIADLVFRYKWDGYKIIFLSGRPDIKDHRVQTISWFFDHDIEWDRLYMRPADMLEDNDADVKQFLFDTYIRNNYRVEFMLDDRDRVVRRMRKLGLKVLQVNEGNF